MEEFAADVRKELRQMAEIELADELIEAAANRVAAAAGVSVARAEELVKALAAAAGAEAAEALTASGPAPTNAVDLRALRLHRMRGSVDPEPQDYEVAALFRISESVARSTITRMEALFSDVREAEASRLASDLAAVPKLDKVDGRDVYRVRCRSRRHREAVEYLLRKAGVAQSEIKPGDRANELLIPAQVGNENSCRVIGVEPPQR